VASATNLFFEEVVLGWFFLVIHCISIVLMENTLTLAFYFDIYVLARLSVKYHFPCISNPKPYFLS
jgi:hypothetical protein